MKKITIFLLANVIFALLAHFSPYALLSVDVKSENSGGLKFFYYTGNAAVPYDEQHQLEKRFASSTAFQKIIVVLPKKSIDRLRMDFFGNDARYEMRKMVVYDEFFTARFFDAEQIVKSYSHMQNMQPPVVENGHVSLKAEQRGAFFYSDGWSCDEKINKAILGVDSLLLLLCLACTKRRLDRVFLFSCSFLKKAGRQHGCFLEDLTGFYRYYKANAAVVKIVLFFLILAYGFKVFNYNYSIDSEVAMFMPDLDVWISQGRFGIAFLKMLLGTLHLIPGLADLLAVFILGVTALVWNYVLLSAAGKKNVGKYVSAAVAAMFVSYPSTAEYMNFSTYNVEVTLGQLFCGIAVYLISQWVFKQRNKWYLFYGLVFMVFGFAMYQAMFSLYLAGACIYAVLHIAIDDAALKERPLRSKVVIGKSAGAFLMGAFLYFMINKLVNLHIRQFTYLDGFIGWRIYDFSTVRDNLVLYAYDLLSGNIIYRGEFYFFAVVILFVLAGKALSGRRENSFAVGGGMIFIALSPFLLPLVLGGAIPVRSQLVLPLITAFSVYILSHTLQSHEGLKRFVIGALLCVSFYQASGIAMLFYGEYMKSQFDVAMAHRIAGQIELVKADKDRAKLVFFVGKYRPDFHPNVVRKQEMIGKSVFEFSDSNKICLFMKSLGYNNLFPLLSIDEILNIYLPKNEAAKKEAQSMPVWPAAGSVVERDDYIIVKLSNDM